MVLLLAPVLSACGRPPKADGEIRIGVVAPFDDETSDVSWQSLKKGALLADREVEARGGLLVEGRRLPVRLVLASNEDSPEATMAVARRLIHRDGVVALVGPIMSRNALVMAGVAENEGIPMISPTASHPDVFKGRRFVFPLAASNAVQGRVLARLAHGDLAASTAGVLFDVASIYNLDLARMFRRELESLGGTVVAFETYVTGQQDYRAQLERIRDASPGVVLLPNYEGEVMRQARQAREMGIEATLLGCDSWDQSRFAGLPELEGAYFVVNWHAELGGDLARSFVDRYTAAFGSQPKDSGALTYDALGLLFRAIEASHGLDGEALREALREIDSYQGVTGTVSLSGLASSRRELAVLKLEGGKAVFQRGIRLDFAAKSPLPHP